MAARLTAQDLVVAEDVIKALKIGAGFNWQAALAAFESGTTQQKIVEGLIAVDDVAQIVGLFFPPAAVIASDLGIAISAEQIVYSLVIWLQQQPGVVKAETTMWSRVKQLFSWSKAP